MRLFALSALVTKPGFAGHNVGYREAANADEARGWYFGEVQKNRPGWTIEDIACLEIPTTRALQDQAALAQQETDR